MAGMRAVPLRQVLEVLARLSPKYAALAAVGVTTGCRISELLHLRRGDILDDNGVIRDRIRFVQLKTRREDDFRNLMIPADFQAYVITHLHAEQKLGYEMPGDWLFRGTCGRPMQRQAVYATFRRMLGTGYGTHWMRKTFAQELYKFFLAENSRDSLRALDLTRQALGHKRIDTTIKYLGMEYALIDRAQQSIFTLENINNAKR